jgi:hypothetical protein
VFKKYHEFLEWEDEQDIYEKNLLHSFINDDQPATQPSKKQRASRTCKTRQPFYVDDDGVMITLDPRKTLWYIYYIQHPPLEDSKFHQKFRRRFRMPHEEFLKLLARVVNNQRFEKWKPGRTDATGQVCSPIELLLLGALRYLGRGLTFDDLEEYTAINEETHRQFLNRFIYYGAKELFIEFVQMPTTAAEYATAAEYETHSSELTLGGLPGA